MASSKILKLFIGIWGVEYTGISSKVLLENTGILVCFWYGFSTISIFVISFLLLPHPFLLSAFIWSPYETPQFNSGLRFLPWQLSPTILSDMSFLLLSNHLRFGLPILLFPGTAIISLSCLHILLLFWKPGEYWNLLIGIPGVEYTGIRFRQRAWTIPEYYPIFGAVFSLVYRINDTIRYVSSIHWSDTRYVSWYVSYHLFNTRYCGDRN